MKDKSVIYKDESDGQMKQCFCVGPENCEDNNCTLVQRYKEAQAKKGINGKENKQSGQS